jgi:glutathione S-transferase
VESATAERQANAARAKAPVLYHIEISHYNEKARWALDYKGIPHVRKAPPPLLHMAWALWLTRSPTFPVLKLDGVYVGDSTRIIETLEREHPEPPLYPPDEGERRRALQLEEHFDEQLGPYIRRWLFHEGLVSLPSGDFIEGALGSAPRPVKTTMRVTAPVGRRILRLRYGIDDEAARVARDKTAAALDRIEAELQRASSHAATCRAEGSSYETFTAPAVGQIRARAQLLAGSLLGGGAAGPRLHAIGVLADAGTVENQRSQPALLLVVRCEAGPARGSPPACAAADAWPGRPARTGPLRSARVSQRTGHHNRARSRPAGLRC